MTFEVFVTVVLGVLGLGLTVIIALVRVIHGSVMSRLDKIEDQLQRIVFREIKQSR